MSKKEKTATVSDFNLLAVSTSELEEEVRTTIDVGSNLAVFGRRGSGKTEICKGAIRKGLRNKDGSTRNDAVLTEIYLNLSVFERVDLGGYPDVLNRQKDGDFVNFLLPAFYRELLKEPDPKIGPTAVVILDEVDKADPTLWAPLLEFTQFHSINGIKLKNLRAVLMTGNLIAEGGNRPSLPLLDRAEKFLVKPNMGDWLAWAGNEGAIHPSITAFINDNAGHLFGDVDPDERYADPSPRGWTRASRLLKQGEEAKWSSEQLLRKVYGCVGKEAGVKFEVYYNYYQTLLPIIDRVYKGDDVSQSFDKLQPSQKLVCCMIACSRLTSQLDSVAKTGARPKHSPEMKKTISYMGKFLEGVVARSPELGLIAIRSQIGKDRLMKNSLDDETSWTKVIDHVIHSAGSMIGNKK